MAKTPVAIYREAPADAQIAMALKSLNTGTANDGQQKLALGWIMEWACGVKFDSFDPASERATAYLLGRRSVALQIAKVIETPMHVFDKKKVTDG